MRLNLITGFTILFWCLLTSVSQAQTNALFSRVDCREHDEFPAEIAFYAPPHTTQDSVGIVAFSEPDELLPEDFTDAWKSWNYVENYAFGKDRGTLPMIADLTALHPYFRDRIVELIKVCKAKGIELAVVETYRTHAKQHEYKTMGKSYTSSGAGKSKHQYGLAIDIVPIVNDVAVWDNTALWRKVGVAGEKLGLRWGGRWRKPYDPGHFEWTGGVSSGLITSGTFPTVPKGAEFYPCLDEDLQLLRKYWTEWETSQSALTRK